MSVFFETLLVVEAISCITKFHFFTATVEYFLVDSLDESFGLLSQVRLCTVRLRESSIFSVRFSSHNSCMKIIPLKQ